MDLSQWSDDILTKTVAGGGIFAVLAALAWKKIIDFRADKRDDAAGQLAQTSFANIIKGQIDEIARMRELILTLRSENKAQGDELLKEIRARYELERKLGEAQRLAGSSAEAAKTAVAATAQASTLAEAAANAAEEGAESSRFAKGLLLEKLAQLEEENRVLKGESS